MSICNIRKKFVVILAGNDKNPFIELKLVYNQIAIICTEQHTKTGNQENVFLFFCAFLAFEKIVRKMSYIEDRKKFFLMFGYPQVIRKELEKREFFCMIVFDSGLCGK